MRLFHSASIRPGFRSQREARRGRVQAEQSARVHQADSRGLPQAAQGRDDHGLELTTVRPFHVAAWYSPDLLVDRARAQVRDRDHFA
jgi:hypothetical protein